MIKIENVSTLGWEAAIRGMRNPMNSWDKSDSIFTTDDDDYYILDGDVGPYYGNCVDCEVGKNDHKLMMKLAQAGSDHSKYRRMIVVYADIVAPLYFWKQMDTYKVGTVANSCSTMHKINEKEFTLDDFSCEHLVDGSIYLLEEIIKVLNDARKSIAALKKKPYLPIKQINPQLTCQKDLWWQIIQLLPSSYNQRRTLMLNYEVLANIYHSRKDHKLDEWREFCKWIESLPYSDIITGGENNGDQ